MKNILMLVFGMLFGFSAFAELTLQQVVECKKSYDTVADPDFFDVPSKDDIFIVRDTLAARRSKAPESQDNGNLYLYEQGVLRKIPLPKFEMMYFANPKNMEIMVGDKKKCLSYNINSVFADRIVNYVEGSCPKDKKLVTTDPIVADVASPEDEKSFIQTMRIRILDDVERSHTTLAAHDVTENILLNRQKILADKLTAWKPASCRPVAEDQRGKASLSFVNMAEEYPTGDPIVDLILSARKAQARLAKPKAAPALAPAAAADGSAK